MIKFDVYDIFPKFILQDRNGYAIAKAMEAGMKYFLEKCQDGVDTLLDIDKMPEWRLDELAWEYNCLYDYNADIDAKRGWIKNALNYYRKHGTADGIKQYLGAYFGEAQIIEWFEGGLDPCKFDIAVTGLRSDENEAWIRAAVEKAKNVRSILRNIIFNGGQSDFAVKTAAACIGYAISEDCKMY